VESTRMDQGLDDDLKRLARAVGAPAPPFDSLESRPPTPRRPRGRAGVVVGAAAFVLVAVAVGVGVGVARWDDGAKPVSVASDGSPSTSNSTPEVEGPESPASPVPTVYQESLPGMWVAADSTGGWSIVLPDGTPVDLTSSPPSGAVISVTPILDQSGVRLHTARLDLASAMEQLCECDPVLIETTADGTSIWQGLTSSFFYAGREAQGWSVIGEGHRDPLLATLASLEFGADPLGFFVDQSGTSAGVVASAYDPVTNDHVFMVAVRPDCGRSEVVAGCSTYSVRVEPGQDRLDDVLPEIAATPDRP